ncbi:hypothetical protein Slin15195_G119210 [Septoria linicola]|uniref:Fe2OG dioxygenase domain-containing protein n=1 Tax=Septoria linicola TaxID=215465 RepID=A0A9Q9B782_9PEZI|nr:hypothetical protein Slin14017_G096200 [Septoria linicola]USW58602.1 hypothetical protein Slin15195_G119210 [Septoria linicola]
MVNMGSSGRLRGLRAELYKVNVYSGPSGMFTSHVYTPRSSTQIGSLVVCLPTDFTGGALAVRHQGHNIEHDWASESSAQEPAVQWAAFYSDCEHEVLEVTSGHRVTLIYNLFLAAGTGLLAGRALSLEPETLPVTDHLRRLLTNPGVMPAGGYLGTHLVHAYPDTHKESYELVPHMLKGADMAIYQAVVACKLRAHLEHLHGNKSLSTWEALPRSPRAHELDHLDENLELIVNRLDLESIATDTERGSDGDSDDDSDTDMYEKYSEQQRERREQKQINWQIVWLNEPGNKEISRVFLAYGNQAELSVKYSSAALIVRVPSWEERKPKQEGPESTTAVEDVIVIDD